MDSVVCFSQYFVNKLNVRSYGNILKSSLLKSEIKAQLLVHIFEDRNLLQEVTTELSNIIVILKTNLKICARDDFKSHFNNFVCEDKSNLIPADKETVYRTILNILENIIPKSFFGCNHNLKIFRKIVKLIILSMNRQFMLLRSTLKKWNFLVKPWNTVSDKISMLLLNKILFWIFKYILCAIICLNFYVTISKVDNDEHKLFFFIKSTWQSYYNRNITKLSNNKVIEKFVPYCLGTKVRRNLSKMVKLKLRNIKKDIPKLHFLLKPGNDCRPIVRYRNDHKNSQEKYKVRAKLNFIRDITQKHQEKLESQYGKIYKQWIYKARPKLYFIKADLSNAFGAIDKEKLIDILNEKYSTYQKSQTNVYVKQRLAQQYKEIITEIRQPLMIRSGSTVYKWLEGLVQGYTYSPALSELYYTYLDEIYFKELLAKSTNEIMLFVRVVDDYLFVTDSLQSGHEFLTALSNYKNVNYEKTTVNFSHSCIKYSNEIVFLGYRYNTETMQVSRANNVYCGQMCFKIAITPAIANLSKFIENRIGQSGIPINGHLFNFYYNNEEIIWDHVFTTFCLSANKFCTILSLLCDRNGVKYLPIYKHKVCVKLSNAIIDTLLCNKPKEFSFVYCINHFKYIALKALLLCARKTAQCDELVPLINIELSKCNCIFGKWREHGSLIDSNGEIKQQAVKEVCRRTDYKVFFKKMESLPDGFQCYNQKFMK